MPESTFLAGGGVAGELLRSIDWSRTPLGAIASWPISLKCAVGTVLHARHPMFLWWGEELIQFYNDAYLPSLGVGKHPAAMGQRGKDCWGEIWPIIWPQIDDVMTRGKASWNEDALVPIFRNGGIEDVYWTYGYSPVYDDEGRIGGTLVVCTETTTRVIAEKALRRSEALFRAVVEKSAEVVSLTSVRADDRSEVHAEVKTVPITYDVNQAALTVSRGAIAEHLGESAMSYFADAPALREEIERCLEQGATIQREMDRTLKSTGEKRRLFVTYAAAPPDLVIVHTEDVTERVKLELQLRQAQKMDAVGRLAGGVAHDFNNMLSVILGNAHLLLPTFAPDDPRREDIEAILDAGERSAELTKQLLAFARRQPIVPQVIDLNDTIGRLLKLLRRLIGEDIELVWKPGPSLGPVLMDGTQLDQILANLAVNAREAIAGVGRLVIETGNASFDQAYCEANAAHLPGNFVQLSVSDNGCGMDKATLAKVFEPFFTTREVGKGTGLGLAMIYGIVQQNGGFINVYSELGLGSTFRIYLPQCAQPNALTGAQSTIVALPRGTETVLIVEDEEALMRLTKRLLEGLGYTVLATAHAREAIALADSATIDLLVTDVIMPVMTGHEVYESLRATRPELKCLYVSGYTAEVIARRGVLNPSAHFLAKPFTREALAHKLREVLEG